MVRYKPTGVIYASRKDLKEALCEMYTPSKKVNETLMWLNWQNAMRRGELEFMND